MELSIGMGLENSCWVTEPASFLTVVMRMGRLDAGEESDEGEVNRRDVGSLGRVLVPYVGRIAARGQIVEQRS